jgi:hypothetical protein
MHILSPNSHSLGIEMLNPGIVGVIQDLIAANAAERSQEERAKRGDDVPQAHGAPLHHFQRREFRILVENRTPFGLKPLGYDFTEGTFIEATGRDTVIAPNHTRKYVFDNEYLKPDGIPDFHGLLQFQIVSHNEEMKGDIQFRIGWSNYFSKENECGSDWEEDGQSSPYWDNFFLSDPVSCSDKICTLSWVLEFKK